ERDEQDGEEGEAQRAGEHHRTVGARAGVRHGFRPEQGEAAKLGHPSKASGRAGNGTTAACAAVDGQSLAGYFIFQPQPSFWPMRLPPRSPPLTSSSSSGSRRMTMPFSSSSMASSSALACELISFKGLS